MARFPNWIRKTMWRRMSAGQQQNACQATLAMMEVRSGALSASGTMAMLRGIPDDPIWIKAARSLWARDDLLLLGKRVQRRLRRERAETLQRAAELKRKQAVCWHRLVRTVGVETQHCPLCGWVSW